MHRQCAGRTHLHALAAVNTVGISQFFPIGRGDQRMESTVFLRKDVDSLNLIADLHTTPAQNTFLRIPHDGRGTPVLLLMAELLVIADVQMHTNILRYLLQIAFSILRTYKTFLRMSRKNQFQNISSRFQYLRGCRLHDHSLRNRCTARGRKKSLSFYLNHTDTADRLDAQILMIAESRNVDTGFLRRLEDRRSFLHLYRLSVDCQMYHHASLPPLRSNRPA